MTLRIKPVLAVLIASLGALAPAAQADGPANITSVNPTTGAVEFRLYTQGYIKSMVPDGQGGIYIGGNFTCVSPVPQITKCDGPGQLQRSGLAQIRSNGTLSEWNPSASKVGTQPRINALAVSQGVVYIGGTFAQMSGQNRSHLAAVGTDGTLKPWSPIVDGWEVSALTVSKGIVYLGGVFSKVSGKPRSNLAAINSKGAVTPWNPGLQSRGGLSTPVSALATSGKTVYVGGQFDKIARKSRKNLAAIDSKGSVTPWNPGPYYQCSSCSPSVQTIRVVGKTVYLGGEFDRIAGQARSGAAAVGTDGVLQGWNPVPNGWVGEITASGSTLYMTGVFSKILGEPRASAAAVGMDGTLLPWNPQAGANSSYPYSTVATSGSRVYLGY